MQFARGLSYTLWGWGPSIQGSPDSKAPTPKNVPGVGGQESTAWCEVQVGGCGDEGTCPGDAGGAGGLAVWHAQADGVTEAD